MHIAHGLLQGGRQVFRFAHSLHGTLDDGERRAEFVAYVHEELLFELVYLAVDADAVAQAVGGEQQTGDIPDDGSGTV